jgi:hypothetical protein
MSLANVPLCQFVFLFSKVLWQYSIPFLITTDTQDAGVLYSTISSYIYALSTISVSVNQALTIVHQTIISLCLTCIFIFEKHYTFIYAFLHYLLCSGR